MLRNESYSKIIKTMKPFNRKTSTDFIDHATNQCQTRRIGRTMMSIEIMNANQIHPLDSFFRKATRVRANPKIPPNTK